jgi:hypothetical protein
MGAEEEMLLVQDEGSLHGFDQGAELGLPNGEADI